VGVANGHYWSSDGATWTAAAGPAVEPGDQWTIRSDGRVAITFSRQHDLWITTDGRTWRDTGQKFIVTDTGEHGGEPAFCIGAGRLVTIVSDGKQTRAYYADLLK
jgi:hypothetical protein